MRRLTLPLMVLFLGACGAETFSPSATYTIEVVGGAVPAYVAPGEEIASLTLRVLDDHGQPVAGREVALEIREGGGAASLTPRSGVDGMLVLHWTAGPGIGPQRVRVTPQGGEPASFSTQVTGFQASKLSVGLFNACAIDFDARAWCWGDGLSDGAARGDSGIELLPDWRPIPVTGGHSFAEIATGSDATCALDLAGAAWCWGLDGSGQLGRGTVSATLCWGTTPCVRYPVPVTGGHSFVKLANAGSTTCAVDALGAVWCWGANDRGQAGIGIGSPPLVTTPTKALTSDSAADLSAGRDFFCARYATGLVECWGYNGLGQIGAAVSGAAWAPTQVNTSERFGKLFSASLGMCGRNAVQETFCWGAVGSSGGGVTRRPELDRFAALGGDFLGDGWGLDSRRHLWWFYGTNGSDLSGGIHLYSICSGAESGCGLGIAGQVWCWGSNTEGELGNGTVLSAFDYSHYPPTIVGGWYPLP